MLRNLSKFTPEIVIYDQTGMGIEVLWCREYRCAYCRKKRRDVFYKNILIKIDYGGIWMWVIEVPGLVSGNRVGTVYCRSARALQKHVDG